MATTEHPNLDWIEVMGTDRFSEFISHYDEGKLRRLRQDIIVKARMILDDIRQPPATRMRNGVPMNEAEYEDWADRAQKALKQTERQIQACNAEIWGRAHPGIMDAHVLSRILELAEDGAELGTPTQDERNALRLLQHYLSEKAR